MRISAELREYAETPDRFTDLAPDASVQRFADERVCILQGPTWASVTGVSVGEDDVEALLAEVRRRVPADKEPVWWIGPSARPSDVYERLRALGLHVPRDRVSVVHGLVLTETPSGPPAGIEVLRIESYDDFVAAREVQWDAFEAPEDRRAKNRAGSGKTSKNHKDWESRSASWRHSTNGRRRWQWRSRPTAASS